ncbi:MAG: carbohydrate-binding protein [Spirochaetales bacterium]|nr:carbohydrate-binding protein [Spirochaetales bacterium]
MSKLLKWNYVILCICLIFLVSVNTSARRRTTSTSTPTPIPTAASQTNTPVPAPTTPSSGGGLAVPGTIQAENYSSMSGVQTESTTDSGGGTNVGWIDAGDWMDYNVTVASTGTYSIQYRVAALSAAGGLSFLFDGNNLGTTTMPVTGGWQTWTTQNGPTVSLSSGNHTIRLSVTAGGFNLNWFSITSGGSVNTATPTPTSPPAATNTPTPASAGGRTLVWSEEFNGSGRVDTGKWKYMIWPPGYVNNELQAYVDRTDNIRQEGGYLIIQGKNDGYNGYQYTSGRIETNQSWTYGRIEARIQLPAFQGSWPAFWMLGANIGSVGWPACGELDIMEHVNTNSTIVGSIHWNTGSTYSLYNGSTTTSVTSWHTYAVEWDNLGIRWFVDSTNYLTANITNNINDTEEFHRPFYIILNLAIGGDWPGNSIDTNGMNSQPMRVDYVRVYQ